MDGDHDSAGTALAARMTGLATRAAELARTLGARQGSLPAMPDPGVMLEAWRALLVSLLGTPGALVAVNADLAARLGALMAWQQRRLAEPDLPLLVAPGPGDRRFRDPAWLEEPAFTFIMQAYLVVAGWIMETVEAASADMDEPHRRQVLFLARLHVDAIAPTNFPATNPVVLRRAAETGGESLIAGMEALLDDIERGGGEPLIRMTDERGFELGETLATTPGKVVFENALMQLIQYAPAGPKVARRPLLIVPPWINKFYILDLDPKKSLIRWATEQGQTVFVISWVNPDASLSEMDFADYLTLGPLAAMDAIERQTGERQVNLAGYCLGGTLAACALAWLAAGGERRVASATFLTTMLDFAEPGELAVFLDEAQLATIERHMEEHGYLDPRVMQKAFNLLRANDLIWSFVINNYLLGKRPRAFDLLYWNGDGTRMPAAMHRYYLRNMYQRNLLREPGALTLAGRPIDLGRIDVPALFVSAEEDHIAPWRSTFAGARLLGGRTDFVLAGSGHVAGIVNPAGSGKYGFRMARLQGDDPDAWRDSASFEEGSWWPAWMAWLGRHAGAKVPARDPAAGPLAPIEDAPGRYVRAKA